MPTYEYQCSKCGSVTEVFQAITEPARRKLRSSDNPQCECHAVVTRLIGSGAGVIFKGSGFYQTDYRSESYKKAAKEDKEGAKGKSPDDGKARSDKPAGGKGEQGKTGKKDETVSRAKQEIPSAE